MFTWAVLTTPWDFAGYGAAVTVLPSGRLVIGGASGDGLSSILTSDDGGATWAPVSTPLDAGGIYGLAYSEALGRLVAVGAESGGVTAIYSDDDGDTWASAGNPFPGGQGQCATWNPDTGLFAIGAYAAGDTVATSSTGTSWTPVSTPFDGGFVTCIVQRGVGLWLAVGYDTDHQYTAMSSPDAAAWELEVGPFDGFAFGTGGLARALVHAAGWVAAGDSPGVVNSFATSPDFSAWTLRPSDADGDGGTGLAYNGTTVLATIGAGPASIFQSDDGGATWVVNPTSPLVAGLAVRFIDTDVAIAVGGSGPVAALGREVAPPNPAAGAFVWVGNNDDYTKTTQTSPDGAAWTERASPLDALGTNAQSVGASGADVIAGGVGGSARSSDSGQTWEALATPLATVNDVLFAAGIVVLCGYGDFAEVIATGSGPSYAVAAVSSPFDGGVAFAAAYSPALTRFVAVGYSASGSVRVLTSDDGGVTWDSRGNPFTADSGFDGFIGQGVCWSAELELFVAVGFINGGASTSLIYTSPDGITWTAQTQPDFSGFATQTTCVAWDATAGLFVVGTNGGGYIATSSDGVIWTARIVDGLSSTLHVAAGAGVWVVAGGDAAGPVAAVSADTVTWAAASTPYDGASSKGYGVAFAASQAPPVPVITSRFFEGYQWRFVFTDLDSVTTTWANGLLFDRQVVLALDETSVITAAVRPDSRQVNEIFEADDDPRLARQNRLVYAFRREGGTPPWKCRAAGVVDIMQDQADPDAAASHLTAHDPWKYLESRPVVSADGEFPGPQGFTSFGIGVGRGDEWIVYLLEATVAHDGPCFIDFGQTAFYGLTNFGTPDDPVYSTIEATEDLVYEVQQGSMVGSVLTDLCTAGHLDIVLRAVYDPDNRPGITHELSVYNLAGSERPAAVFGWDRLGRSAAGLDRMGDGTPGNWVNKVQYYVGQGGPPASLQVNFASVAKYGAYWSQQFFPLQTLDTGEAVLAMARQAIKLGKQGKRTTSVQAVPERSPVPLRDYELGDRVRVYASRDFRVVSEGYQRVQAIPIQITDDGIETVAGLLCSPDWVEAGS